jgi:hypothetical protein
MYRAVNQRPPGATSIGNRSLLPAPTIPEKRSLAQRGRSETFWVYLVQFTAPLKDECQNFYAADAFWLQQE